MFNNNDFKSFQEQISWFIKPNSAIVLKENVLRLNEDFRATFPKLTSLIEKARVIFLEIDKIEYVLLAWNNKENLVSGWLNKIEKQESHFSKLIPEHELLLSNIGGIQESFNQPENSFSNNQNFMFIESQCSEGIGDWGEYYLEMCRDENLEQMKHSQLLAFAQEANGALTLYDPQTKKVLLFSHDHNFDNVNFIEHQPQYTFHTFTEVDSFIDYVEGLATQWAAYLKE